VSALQKIITHTKPISVYISICPFYTGPCRPIVACQLHYQSYSHVGATWRIRLNLCFLRPTRVHNSNGKSTGSSIFAQITVDCRYTLQSTAAFPLKITPSHGGCGPRLTHGSLGPTRDLNPNGISIGSAVFAGLTDRATDAATRSVTTVRIYVRSTATRPM